MVLKDFTKKKNRQRPDWAYKYVCERNPKKYEIFTLDGGNTFLASIESFALNGRTYLSDGSKDGFKSAQEALDWINQEEQ